MIKKQEQTGLFRKNKKGFGFVTVEGEDEDYYISRRNMADAFHMDTVRIVPIEPGGDAREGHRREAKIVGVVERAVTTVVGVYEQSGRDGYVRPDDAKLPQEIHISPRRSRGAEDGQKVVCHVLSYGSETQLPEGEVTEIIGYKDDPGVDILSVVKRYSVPIAFAKETVAEAKKVSSPVKKKDFRHRLDLTKERMVTIDGDDTKDFDDAVSIRRDGDDYILGVHIADVSHYVQEDGALDREAHERGTSIYLTDRVIPMLPQVLSNGICSLNEGENRLALSCIMRIDKKGKVVKHEIAESVIRVTHRMTYHDVNEILENANRTLCVRYADVLGDFFLMQDLSRRIRRKRAKRGAVDFEFPEAKIKLDRTGHAIAVEARERGIAEMMIEDFMLSANETIAETFFSKEIPFLYRNHGKPDEEKITSLRKMLAGFGLSMGGSGGEASPKDMQKLLKKVQGRPEEGLLSVLVLRSMQRAEYAPENVGHFGLAAEYYCHFTSPIRRYPDLIVHRIIKEQLHGKLKRKRQAHYLAILPQLAKQTSEAERRAEDMEREVDKMKMIEYMADHIGEVYEGKISGVTSWGMYVELPNTIEGMVPLRLMWGDYYEYFEESYELVGQRTHRRFTLGDAVTIQVDSADVEARLLDFSLYEERRPERPKTEKKRMKHGRKKPKAHRKQQKSKS